MRKKRGSQLSRLASVTLAVAGLATVLFASAAEAQNADPNIVVVLRGPSELMDNLDAPIPGALCYEAELVNAHTDVVIGTGIDCLEDIAQVGDAFAINRTTFLSFPQGELVANGPTTVAPFVTAAAGFTHVVGEIPEANSIIDGTGRFAGRTGTVRLSGAVGLTNFPAEVLFNCIFVIDLD